MMENVVCHLIFPYEWVNCPSPDVCIKAAHLDGVPEDFNEAPLQWVVALLGCSTIDGGRVTWKNEHGELHRLDGPAEEEENGYIIWCLNGSRHRFDGPAEFDGHDYSSWWLYGKKHREGGPAAIGPDSEKWWSDGKLHRVDGPAITWKSGSQYWYQNGKMHRLDGPAFVGADGTVEWWINGVKANSLFEANSLSEESKWEQI